MLVKKHKTPDGQLILAVCDDELLGKQFEEGDKVLDLSGDFFKGEEMNEGTLDRVIKQAYMANAIGEKSVKFFTDRKLADNVVTVDGIPNAQLVIIRE